jgi:hypothetical protein
VRKRGTATVSYEELRAALTAGKETEQC